MIKKMGGKEREVMKRGIWDVEMNMRRERERETVRRERERERDGWERGRDSEERNEGCCE